MIRRALCCLICLLLTLAPALTLAEESYSMAGFDGTESTHDWNTNQFFTRMQERTGIGFTFQQYTDIGKWQAAKAQMFTAGELPDVLFKAALTTEEQLTWSESGQLIDLLPLLPENAPNLWKLLQENPDWLKAITLPNGKVCALPELQTQPAQNALWINQAWLDTLKLDMPTDFASLRTVLEAFRDRDPNANGKRDEIPLAFLGPWELKFLSHAYGVAVNDYNIYLDESGTVRYWPAEDSFFAWLTELRSMFADKLLDPEGFRTADTLRRITDDKAAVTFGAFFAPTPVNLVTFKQAEQYVLMEPLVYEGKQVYRDLIGSVTRGVFAITSACENPAALLQWVDLLYTEEGAVEAMLGKENDCYVINEEGRWQWKGGVESMTSTIVNELSIYDTGDMPWLFPQAFYNRYDEAAVRRVNDELEKLTPFIQKPFPTYTLTKEQSAQIIPLQNVLGQYVDEAI
ncbi:MAG: extracellular solute-binding protein, partial [Clostridia bacterium]